MKTMSTKIGLALCSLVFMAQVPSKVQAIELLVIRGPEIAQDIHTSRQLCRAAAEEQSTLASTQQWARTQHQQSAMFFSIAESCLVQASVVHGALIKEPDWQQKQRLADQVEIYLGYASFYARAGLASDPLKTFSTRNAVTKTEDTTFIIAILRQGYDYYGDFDIESQR